MDRGALPGREPGERDSHPPDLAPTRGVPPDRAWVLAATGVSADEFGAHYETIVAGEALGLRLQTCAVSDRDEWDRFEGAILSNSERWAHDHPQDPDPSFRLQQRRDWNLAQQRWGRDTMGFGLYLFRKGA